MDESSSVEGQVAVVLPVKSDSEELGEYLEHTENTATAAENEVHGDSIHLSQENIKSELLAEKLDFASMENEEQTQENYIEKDETEVLMAEDQPAASVQQESETDQALEIHNLMQENSSTVQPAEDALPQTSDMSEQIINVSNIVPVTQYISQPSTQSQEGATIKIASLQSEPHTVTQPIVKNQLQIQSAIKQSTIQLIQQPSQNILQAATTISQIENLPSPDQGIQSLVQSPAESAVSSTPSMQLTTQAVNQPSTIIAKQDPKQQIAKIKMKPENITVPVTTVMTKPAQPRLIQQTVNKVTAAKPKTAPAVTDDLATLATAALTCNQTSNGLNATEVLKKEPVWCDVGVIKGTSCFVNSYYEPNFSHDQEHEFLTVDTMPDLTNSFKLDLEPGTAYKFRVAAINSCGRGPWSEVSAFKTCLPGYPGAPSSIKISKSAEGAHLSWEPPSNPAGNIIEYSVCLAVRNNTQQTGADQKTQLAFVRVYSGPQNQTVVPNTSLAAAHIDTTSKPAIIFRIAAKNEKGFGPATQVRWLQDVVAAPGGTLKPLPKKEPLTPNIPIKRPKIEDF